MDPVTRNIDNAGAKDRQVCSLEFFVIKNELRCGFEPPSDVQQPRLNEYVGQATKPRDVTSNWLHVTYHELSMLLRVSCLLPRRQTKHNSRGQPDGTATKGQF